jgi:hypothetical protein
VRVEDTRSILRIRGRGADRDEVSTGFGPSTGETSARDAAPPPGVAPPAAPGGRPGFLSDVIVELGFAERDTVEQAVRAARSPGTTVARVLVETGAVSEEQLAQALAERYGIDYVDLDAFQVDPTAANLIAPAAARRYQAVPVAFLGTGLLVAVADPADALGTGDVELMTNLDARQAVASRPALEALLDALPLEESEPQDTPPPLPPAAKEPVPLREGLESLKHQLAGVEAKLATHAEVAPAESADALGARLAEAEAELEAARMRVREAKEVAAELETLRERLAATEAGLDEAAARARAAELGAAEADALRAQLAAVTRERDSARARAREAYGELRRLRTDHEEDEASHEATSAPAEVTESELQQRLAAERRRRAELEERLAALVGSASAAERAFGELRRAEARIRDALQGWRS